MNEDIDMIKLMLKERKGEINFDSNMPDGVKRKLLNIDKIQQFGWNPIISLDDGLKLTYQAFQDENKGYLDEA